jgi:hypothetical protein
VAVLFFLWFILSGGLDLFHYPDNFRLSFATLYDAILA